MVFVKIIAKAEDLTARLFYVFMAAFLGTVKWHQSCAHNIFNLKKEDIPHKEKERKRQAGCPQQGALAINKWERKGQGLK